MTIKTLKLKIIANTNAYIDMQHTYTSCYHFCFNRFQEKLKEKEVRSLAKPIFQEILGSYILQCAVLEAKALYSALKTNKKCQKVIFGGKHNLERRKKNIISNDEWKNLRLKPICCVGQANQKSNRCFNFDLKNGKLIFKPNKNTKIGITLEGIGRNRQEDLDYIQSQIGKMPVTVSLNQNYCYIIFDDNRKDEQYQAIKGRTAGIDLNPNYIGFVVRDKNNDLLYKIAYDISKIEKNKQIYELTEISKQIQHICKHYQIEKIGVEKLTISPKDHNKGKRYNRLCNNKWNRQLFVNQLEKRLTRIGVEVIFVLPQYSSYIGNLTNNMLFDPIASAAEIARRAVTAFEKVLCIWSPIIPQNYQNLWKKEDNLHDNWMNIISQIKNSKIRYRIPLDNYHKNAVYRFISTKSLVSIIKY